MDGVFQTFLDLLNETLAATIVVVAASLMLYNLSRNLYNRVTRASAVVLACVTVAYISDVLVSLGPGAGTFESLLRLQWVGLAFIPAAMFHLSDALLATTGLPSRGRRRRVIRMLYTVAAVFLLLAAFTDLLVTPEHLDGRISLRAAPLFAVYLVYYLGANGVAFINVERARRRCLTHSTKRRMGYLEIAMLTPVVGIFPYSVLLGPGQEFSITALVLVNLANFLMVLMLLFLSYPLSFFGSDVPDRVVKAELLRFVLRGPATGLLALVVILYTRPATDLLGLPGDMFMPFAVVAVILIWQWSVDLALPWLEKHLVYHEEDDAQLARLQRLSERLLTRGDLLQLIEATLEATCDSLRVNGAFATMLVDQNTLDLVGSTGSVEELTNEAFEEEASVLVDGFSRADRDAIKSWRSFWVMPLFSARSSNTTGEPSLIGLMGVEARSESIDLSSEEKQMLDTYVHRAAQTLDDLLLQNEIAAALEGLLPQIAITRERAAAVEFKPGHDLMPQPNNVLDREQVIEQVHAALRHYWGGPGLSSSRLLELFVVRDAMVENDENPVRALRAVLLEAIENQCPDGERDFKSTEWTLYNILQLRFIEKRKVRETARRLFMSEANLYRKQNVAIEAVADTLIKMEDEALAARKRVLSE